MRRLLGIALMATLSALPAGLGAQLPYRYPGVPGPQEYLDFISGSGVNGGYGVQVGPYLGEFTTDLTTARFSLYCVDYLHYARDQWVNTTSLGPLGDLANTRQSSYTIYQQAAYLSSLFDSAPTDTWGGIHAAIWSLTSGVTQGDATQRQYYLDLAAANAAAFNTDGWYVLSPLSAHGSAFDGTGQEFLMRTTYEVSEPAAFLLMATGLLLLAAFSRKRLVGLRVEGA